MRPDGRANVFAVMRDLMARPAQLSPLARIAAKARVRRRLGPHFGLLDH